MSTAIPTMLAVIRRDMEELCGRGMPFKVPSWWAADLAPPAAIRDGDARSDQDLVLALRLVIGAAETLFRDRLYQGELVCWGRPGSSLAEYSRAPTWAVVGIESWWKGGGIVRLEDGEKLYAVRIEPTTDRRIPEAELEGWFRRNPEISAAESVAAVRSELGGYTTRELCRKVRRRLGIRLRPGRRKK